MKFTKTICGLLWLAFSAATFATTFTIQDQNFDVDDGGGFQAYLGSNSNNLFEVYCVDYRNFVTPPQSFTVNVDTLPNVADTRYGDTAQAAFSFQTDMLGDSLGNAVNRYTLAAYLTTQYDLGNVNDPMNTGIQEAIWTLLNVNGANFQSTAENTELNAAVNWEKGLNASQLTAFQNEVTVYSSTLIDAAGTGDARYTAGYQEMITVTPEPAVLGLVGSGLLLIGLRRRRA